MTEEVWHTHINKTTEKMMTEHCSVLHEAQDKPAFYLPRYYLSKNDGNKRTFCWTDVSRCTLQSETWEWCTLCRRNIGIMHAFVGLYITEEVPFHLDLT